MRRNGLAQQGRIRAGQAGASLLPGQKAPALVQRQQRERVRRPAVAQPFPAGAPDHRPDAAAAPAFRQGEDGALCTAQEGYGRVFRGEGLAQGQQRIRPGGRQGGAGQAQQIQVAPAGAEIAHGGGAVQVQAEKMVAQPILQAAGEQGKGLFRHGSLLRESMAEAFAKPFAAGLGISSANVPPTLPRRLTHIFTAWYNLSCVPLDGAPVAKKGLL